jgi:arginine N-succinyltransferase
VGGPAAHFEIRGATASDVDSLFALSRHLDTVNLPHDRALLADLVAQSEAAFAGSGTPPGDQRYMFVLHDIEAQRVVGTSMIIAKLGTRAAPYVYFDVSTEERYSASLDRHFRHTVLRTAYSYDGPTELGGLVVHPAYRGHPARLGKLISFARLLYLAARPERFERTVVAELMPPLEPDGTSHLWEAIGRKFTGLDFRKADQLSRRNKEFIKGLFPDGAIYATLLPPAAQGVIGEVGDATKAVAQMLRSIGFRYAERVDPFDGGPHYLADVSEISPLLEAAELLASGDAGVSGRVHLIGELTDGPPFVRLRATRVSARTHASITVEADTLGALGRSPADRLWSMPIEGPYAPFR